MEAGAAPRPTDPPFAPWLSPSTVPSFTTLDRTPLLSGDSSPSTLSGSRPVGTKRAVTFGRRSDPPTSTSTAWPTSTRSTLPRTLLT